MTGGLRSSRHEAHGIQSACGTSGAESFGQTLGLSSPNSNSKKKEKKSILVTQETVPSVPGGRPTGRLDQTSVDPHPGAISVCVGPVLRVHTRYLTVLVISD